LSETESDNAIDDNASATPCTAMGPERRERFGAAEASASDREAAEYLRLLGCERIDCSRGVLGTCGGVCGQSIVPYHILNCISNQLRKCICACTNASSPPPSPSPGSSSKSTGSLYASGMCNAPSPVAYLPLTNPRISSYSGNGLEHQIAALG
jgi:hypothetical protein